MVTQPRVRNGLQTAAIALLAAAQVVAGGGVCLVAYIDADLQRGGWSWAAEGWVVAVAVLFCLAAFFSLQAVVNRRFRLAWTLALTPPVVALALLAIVR